MATLTTQIDEKTSTRRKETERFLRNRALLWKIHRHLNAGHLVQMRDPKSGDPTTIVRVDIAGDKLMGNRDGNELPWNGLFGDHVLIGGETLRLNARPTTKTIDPGVKLLDLAGALNSMTDWKSGSVFIAGTCTNGGDFFLVEYFTTDGDRLYAVARHDGTCHDIVGGWVYDLRYRRYVYGDDGPLEDGMQ
jgi:hypothetical protein